MLIYIYKVPSIKTYMWEYLNIFNKWGYALSI